MGRFSSARPVLRLLAVCALAWSAAALGAQPKLPSGEPEPPKGPNPFLAQAKELYQKLDFEKCLQRLGQAPQWRSSPRELLEIELYAGMCSYNLNQLPQAEEHFRLALRIAPTAELPPYTSPKLVEFFRRVKKSMPKVKVDKAEREREEKEKAEAERAEKERVEKERAEAERAEKEKAEQEKAERERAEKERAEREKAEKALAAGPSDEKDAKAQKTDAAAAAEHPPSDAPLREDAVKPKEEVKQPPPGLPRPSFARRHAGPLAVGAGAVVALAVGIGLGANAKSLEARANQARFDADFHTLGSQARASATGANVAYAVAAAAAVGALVWLWLQGLDPR